MDRLFVAAVHGAGEVTWEGRDGGTSRGGGRCIEEGGVDWDRVEGRYIYLYAVCIIFYLFTFFAVIVLKAAFVGREILNIENELRVVLPAFDSRLL